jgi:hypothetical protein
MVLSGSITCHCGVGPFPVRPCPGIFAGAFFIVLFTEIIA